MNPMNSSSSTATSTTATRSTAARTVHNTSTAGSASSSAAAATTTTTPLPKRSALTKSKRMSPNRRLLATMKTTVATDQMNGVVRVGVGGQYSRGRLSSDRSSASSSSSSSSLISHGSGGGGSSGITQQFSDLHIQNGNDNNSSSSSSMMSRIVAEKTSTSRGSSLRHHQAPLMRKRQQRSSTRSNNMIIANDPSITVRSCNNNETGENEQQETTSSDYSQQQQQQSSQQQQLYSSSSSTTTMHTSEKRPHYRHQRGTAAPASSAMASFDDRAGNNHIPLYQQLQASVYPEYMIQQQQQQQQHVHSHPHNNNNNNNVGNNNQYQSFQQQQQQYNINGRMSTSTAAAMTAYHTSNHNHNSSSSSSTHPSQQALQNANSATSLPSSIPPNTHTISFVNNGHTRTLVFCNEKMIGKGSFGEVFLARIHETNETVAIKKVLQDRRFKNRELQIMRTLSHQSVVQMRHSFYTKQRTSSSRRKGGSSSSNSNAHRVQPIDPSTVSDSEDLFLNLVLEYVPDTVYRFVCQYTRQNDFMPMIYVKLFVYQMCRALNYIHSRNICHRDIKPQNLLIDPVKGILKLCDFGSAKQLSPNEPNVSYICSRYYRAPELIFGATNYTTAIDIWSLGCVFGEMITGQPLFAGESSVDQLVEIIRVLGTPTRQEVESMNKNYTEFKFPQVKPHPWPKVFGVQKNVPSEAIDLIQRFLQYSPGKRILPLDALAHPFFDELRDPRTRLPNGKPLPQLFDLSLNEIKMLSDPNLKYKIIPKQYLSGFDLEIANDISLTPGSRITLN